MMFYISFVKLGYVHRPPPVAFETSVLEVDL